VKLPRRQRGPLPSPLLDRAHRALRAFQEQHGPLMASAVGFWALLSIPPLLLLGVALLGQLLGSSDEAFRRVMQYARTLLSGETEYLHDLLQEVIRNRGPVGTIGFAVLAWTGTQALVTLENALNAQWGVPVRHFLISRLLALCILVIVSALFLTSTLVTGWITAISQWSIPWLGWRLERIPFLWQVAGYLVPLLLTLTMFALLYRVLPNVPVSGRAAWAGAAIAAPAWEAAKVGYAWFLARFTDYPAIYGSLHAFVGLVLWIYYASVILLLGSEWVRLTEADRATLRVPLHGLRSDGRARGGGRRKGKH
jgi:membrane protein